MGRDSKPKESGDKGKGKQAASSATDDNASNGKGKGGKSSDGLDTCTFVKGKKRGDLGWFQRGKMAGPFLDATFRTPIGAASAPFKSRSEEELSEIEGDVNINHNSSVMQEDSSWEIKGKGIFSRELMFSLRTPVYVKSGEQNTIWGHLELPVSRANEEAICHVVRQACKCALSAYHTTVEEM
ncbi:hypothetical protein MUK42_03082 [Musa troglodytarum]|uniref:Peptidyl-prolyl cis-trans isomerase n=1 Tax=Musa troglodytarum TaxID=320322 RepID=A0A9E7GUE6_9LILI|nr:hypothetical protein MUK42_03082 [Musa troglodytarum]